MGIYLAIVDKLSPYGHHGKKVQNESEDEFEEMDLNEDGTIGWNLERMNLVFPFFDTDFGPFPWRNRKMMLIGRHTI